MLATHLLSFTHRHFQLHCHPYSVRSTVFIPVKCICIAALFDQAGNQALRGVIPGLSLDPLQRKRLFHQCQVAALPVELTSRQS